MLQINSNRNLQSQQRIISLDLLRIVAAFAVIMIHTSSPRFSEFSSEWEIVNIYDSLSRWCVPVFVMISGALFLDTSKNVSIKKLYGKNVLHILSAYLIWSIVYKIYTWQTYQQDLGFKNFLRDITYGHFHLWFLKMLLGLYIAVPILRVIASNKKIELYFLSLAIVTANMLPFFFHYVEMFFDIECFRHFYEGMKLKIASEYVGYFVLGHVLKTYVLTRKQIWGIYLLGVICFIGTIVLNSIFSHHVGLPTEECYGYLNPLVLMEAIAVFLFVFHIGKHISIKLHPAINNISSMSFGIYLVHMLIMMLLKDNFGIDTHVFHPLFSIPCMSLLTFVLSYLCAWLLHFIPFSKRFLL